MHADILIVTATKVESKAVFQIFQGATGEAPKPVTIDDRMYHNLGSINGAEVFMIQSEMGTGGPGSSQQTVQRGIAALSPSAIIMVGIAFGINAEKQSIGDILVSKQLLLYDLQRIGTEDGRSKIVLRGERPHASPWLLNVFTGAELHWGESNPKVRFGLILCGEKLVDNIDFRQQLSGFGPEAIGGEMEGAGLYVACLDRNVNWILVKAICDWADGNKVQNKDEHQRLAAQNAASFVLHVIEQTPLKHKGELQEPTTPVSKEYTQLLSDVSWSERNRRATEYFIDSCEECPKEEDRLVQMLKSWQLLGPTKDGLSFSVEGALLLGPNERLPTGFYTDVQINDRRFQPHRLKNLNGYCLLAILKELREALSEFWEVQWENPAQRDEMGRPLKMSQYPETAVVEAMVNFVIHRDFAVDDLAQIIITDNYIKFVNPGTSSYSSKKLLSAEEPLIPKYERNQQIIRAISRTRLNQRQGGGIIRIREALKRNGNVREDGTLGLDINNDNKQKRFSLTMYRAVPSASSPIIIEEIDLNNHSSLPRQPYFFGREEELAKIADALLPELRSWGILIDGPGGIGKTALAIRAAQLASVEHFPLKIFLSAKVRELTAAGEQPLPDFMLPNFIALISELAAEIGIENIARTPPDDRANLVRRELAGKHALIIIDNVETFEEKERIRLYQFLSRLPDGCKVIVTSRRRTDIDARVLRLDRLELKDALDLIAELATSNRHLARANEKERQDLYEITGGSPLLMKWVAGQLGREGSQCHTIAEACKFIESAPKDNDPLEYIFGDLLGTFTDSETTVLATLTHFTRPAKVEWIADLSGLALRAAETALEDLADRALLVNDEVTATFLLPASAAIFLRRKRPDIIAQTGNRLIDWVYKSAIQNGYQNYERFSLLETEWPMIAASLPLFLAGDNTRLQTLCAALTEFLNFSGRWDDRLLLSQQAEEKALTVGDYNNAGWRAYEAGRVHYLRSHVSEVLACATRCEAYWRKSSTGTKEKAMAIQLRGAAFEIKHNYIAAIAEYRDALTLYQSQALESIDTAILLNALADVESASGDYVTAERDYHEALRIAREINDQEGAAMSTGNLAILALERQDWSTAEALAREALTLAESVGRVELIGIDCYQLTKILVQKGQLQEGLLYARRAVEIFAKLRLPKYLEEAQATLKEVEANVEAVT